MNLVIWCLKICFDLENIMFKNIIVFVVMWILCVWIGLKINCYIYINKFIRELVERI